MNTIELSYCGFFLGWNFYDDSSSYPSMESIMEGEKIPQTVFEDISDVLNILNKYELLIPTYAILENKIEIKADTLEEFCFKLRIEFDKNQNHLSIERIGGKGIVYLNNNEKVLTEDLIWFDEIRTFERQFSIRTGKSIWVPLDINLDYNYDWHIKMSELNAPRLEQALSEIKKTLKMSVVPGEDEIEKENPIWMKGFKLFPNPEILQREFDVNPPKEIFKIEEYLKEINF